MYARIVAGVIEALFCGDQPEEAIVVPDTFQGWVGQSVKEFDPDWNLLQLSKRVADGFVSIPEGFKLEGEEFIPLSQIERLKSGLDPVPERMVIDGDRLRMMTREELISSGAITSDVAADEAMEEEITALVEYLEETGWYADRASDYIGSNGKYGKPMPEEVAEKRQSARDRISALRG